MTTAEIPVPAAATGAVDLPVEHPRVGTPQPGIYPGVPYSVYQQWDAINHSTLKWFSRSPAHARHYRLSPPAPSPAMVLGSAGHVAVLEPARFDDVYVRGIVVDKRTTVGKAAWERFRCETAGREILGPEEHDLCLRLRDAVWSHDVAAELLRAPGGNEVSVLWRDEPTGVLCKGRLDAIRAFWGWTVVLDLKTAKDASPAGFSRACAGLGYAEQSAMYLDGLSALDPRPRRFIHIAVEKDRPHPVAVYELDEQAIDLGRRQWRAHVRTYAECMKTGKWGGYGDGLVPLSLPRWALVSNEPSGAQEE